MVRDFTHWCTKCLQDGGRETERSSGQAAGESVRQPARQAGSPPVSLPHMQLRAACIHSTYNQLTDQPIDRLTDQPIDRLIDRPPDGGPPRVLNSVAGSNLFPCPEKKGSLLLLALHALAAAFLVRVVCFTLLLFSFGSFGVKVRQETFL